MSFVLELVRPYRGWLVIVFAAMMVEIAMSLAAPWPLKLVLDDALGHHRLPEWAEWAHTSLGIGHHTMGVAVFAALATLAIAIVGAIAAYIDNYYTTSIGQWVAALLADLKKREGLSPDKLVLYEDSEHWGYHHNGHHGKHHHDKA